MKGEAHRNNCKKVMITIKNTATGETFKYSGANKEFAIKDSFCTNNKTGVQFRRNWNAVVEIYIENPHFTQCLLRDNFVVVL